MDPVRATDTGFTQLIENIPNKIPEFDSKKGDHLWVIFVTHRVVNPTKLKDGPAYLDFESLLAISSVGCYYCEREYRPLLLNRRCKGQP